MYEEQDRHWKTKDIFSHWASQMQPVGRSNITVWANMQNQANDQDSLNSIEIEFSTGILSAQWACKHRS